MINGLQSARAKIIRTMEYYDPVEKCIAKYTSRHPYKEITQSDGHKTLKIIEAPPIEIPIFAGEILYHLRSALDHLFSI